MTKELGTSKELDRRLRVDVDPLSFDMIEAEVVGLRDTIVIRDRTPKSQFPAVWMSTDEAVAVRDWLNKVLPT
jgi:hypothetical protein